MKRKFVLLERIALYLRRVLPVGTDRRAVRRVACRPRVISTPERPAVAPYRLLLAIAATLIRPAFCSLTRPDPAENVERKPALTLVSDAYRLDKIYHSMEGPFSIASRVHVDEAAKCPVQWITGLETQVVDAADLKPISQKFFCHSNLTLTEHGPSPAQFNQRFGGKTHLDWRLFTLIPGRLSIELPKGFGIPVPADTPL